MADSVGTAYLTLVPKLQSGWSGSVNGELSRGVNGNAAGKSAGGGFSSGFKDVVKGIAASAAVAKIADTAGQTFMQAFNGAASRQQLEGGVNKLYGGAADDLMKYANDAFKTVGMSTNEYMDLATQFSASLVNELGKTPAAADATDRAMRVMSDNANTFGTDMESVQNAFKGFAKGNYTMLDNLKLGFAGSKEGMQSLLDEAEKASGKKYDINSLNDIIEAIDVYQDKMGVANTSENELKTTVEGSLKGVKAAWDNLLVGLGDGNANIGELMSNLGTSIGTALDNVLPLVGTIIGNVGQLLADNAPELLEKGIVLFDGLVKSAAKKLPEVLPQVVALVGKLAATLVSNAPRILAAGLSLLGGLIKAIPKIIPQVVTAGKNIVSGLVQGIGSAKDAVVQKIKDICAGALDAVKSFFGIKSPSRVMAQMGDFMMQGLSNGIGGGQRGVLRTIDGVNRSMLNGFASPAFAGASAGFGGVTVNLNYSAGADANQMARDLGMALRRRAALEG